MTVTFHGKNWRLCHDRMTRTMCVHKRQLHRRIRVEEPWCCCLTVHRVRSTAQTPHASQLHLVGLKFNCHRVYGSAFEWSQSECDNLKRCANARSRQTSGRPSLPILSFGTAVCKPSTQKTTTLLFGGQESCSKRAACTNPSEREHCASGLDSDFFGL